MIGNMQERKKVPKYLSHQQEEEEFAED
jgi:hypothetical protein